MKLKFAATVALAATLFTGAASAATISEFNERHTNDGVFSLTTAQASFLGAADAEYIGFLRVWNAEGTYDATDTFDADTIRASTPNSARLLAILNGGNSNLLYTGEELDPLGLTQLGTATNYFRAVAFLFDEDAGNIVFTTDNRRNTATFNAGQSRGEFDLEVAPVPLPAAAWMLLAGVGGLAVASRKKKARSV